MHRIRCCVPNCPICSSVSHNLLVIVMMVMLFTRITYNKFYKTCCCSTCSILIYCYFIVSWISPFCSGCRLQWRLHLVPPLPPLPLPPREQATPPRRQSPARRPRRGPRVRPGADVAKRAGRYLPTRSQARRYVRVSTICSATSDLQPVVAPAASRSPCTVRRILREWRPTSPALREIKHLSTAQR